MVQKKVRLTRQYFTATAEKMLIIRAIVQTDNTAEIIVGSCRVFCPGGYIGYFRYRTLDLGAGTFGQNVWSVEKPDSADAVDAAVDGFIRLLHQVPATKEILMLAKPIVVAYVNTRGQCWSVEEVPPHTTRFLVVAGMALARLEASSNLHSDGTLRSFYADVSVNLRNMIQQQLLERERQVGIIAL